MLKLESNHFCPHHGRGVGNREVGEGATAHGAGRGALLAEEAATSILEVPGARISYDVAGRGPVMVLVPGANGTADAFSAVREHLARRYTVVTYDRRGFSRSNLDGRQDYRHRLETDADDVRGMIEHGSAQSATVVGVSSGAVVALEVLTRHPSTVRTLVSFEPPRDEAIA